MTWLGCVNSASWLHLAAAASSRDLAYRLFLSCRYSTSFRSACLLYRRHRARTPAAHVLFKKNLNLMENFLGTLNLRFISLLPHEKLFTERRANCTLANLKVANERQVPRSLSHLPSTNLLGDEVVMSCLID